MNAERIEGVLWRNFTYEEISAFLGYMEQSIEAITLGRDLKAVSRDVVAAAGTQGWLVSLVERMHAEKPENEEVGAVWADVQRPLGANGRPWEEHVLRRRRLFVDRKDLRQAVSLLKMQDGATALLVDGPPCVGKSYSTELLTHVADATQQFRFHAFDPAVEPLDLAFDIISRIGGTPKDRRDEMRETTLDRVVTRLVDWIGSEIERLGKPRWLFFDACRRPSVPQRTRELILGLMKRADSELRHYLRVIAVDFPEAIPADIAPGVERETVAAIDQLHLEQVIKARAGARQKSLGEAPMKDAIARIWTEYPPVDEAGARAAGKTEVELNDARKKRLAQLTGSLWDLLQKLELV